jgi:uncharacterized phage protein gp47/JayE
MYESVTEEVILNRILSRIPDTLDKRPGSIIYYAVAPAAREIAQVYACLDDIIEDSFADTAARKYLVRRTGERGLSPYPATHAVWRGEFNIDVPIGSRYSIDDLNYVVVRKLEDHAFELQCETEGIIGNELDGDLIPVEYVDGLERAELVQLLIRGEDEEDTEAFRTRYFESFLSQPFGGNNADYKAKTLAIPGVGAVRVISAWRGGGTVKLVIADAQYRAPTQSLVTSVQKKIDPTQKGDGVGLVPIGHVVTVEGVSATVVDVAATLEYETEYDWPAVQTEVYAKLDDYYAELSRSFGASQQITIRISQIEIRLLSVQGIADIAGTQINGATANLILESNKVPQRGAFNGS